MARTKVKTKRVKAMAVGSCFGIEIVAKITPAADVVLDREEYLKLTRKLKHQLAQSISKLPYGDILPFEVSLQ